MVFLAQAEKVKSEIFLDCCMRDRSTGWLAQILRDNNREKWRDASELSVYPKWDLHFCSQYFRGVLDYEQSGRDHLCW